MKCTFQGFSFSAQTLIGICESFSRNHFSLQRSIFWVYLNMLLWDSKNHIFGGPFLPIRSDPLHKQFFLYIFIHFYDIPPNGEYYPFAGQYLPINGFEFTFHGVIQLCSVNRTWLSLCVIRSFAWTESLLESDWGNQRQTSFEWFLCGITLSEYLVIGIGFTWIESESESDWGNWTRTMFEWSHCGSLKVKILIFFYVIPLIGIICPINGVLLTGRIFWKGNNGSDERTFFSH